MRNEADRVKVLSGDKVQIQQLTVETPYAVGMTHIYSAAINGVQVLFDTGPPTEKGKNFLRENVDLQNLKYVFITHWHPEHCGLTDFLATETDAIIFLSKYEVRKFRDQSLRANQLNNLFLNLGFPAEESAKMKALVKKSLDVTPLPHRFCVLEESEELLAELGISYLHCSWHSQTDLIYLFGDYAVIGDVALKEIFSAPLLDVDFGYEDGRRFSNYSAFCAAIAKLKAIDDRILLPGHCRQLESVSVWLEFLLAKVLERARVVAPYLRSCESAYEVVQEIFEGQTDSRFLLYLKASEIVFLSDFLRDPGQLLNTLALHRLCPDLAGKLSRVNLSQQLS